VDEENKSEKEQKPSPLITKKERLYLSIGDMLMIVMILVDLLYLSGLIQLSGNDILAVNVLVVSISYVVYEMKRRVRKRTIREMGLNK
jgi:hypothetical protein